jgi:hypothetical protein
LVSNAALSPDSAFYRLTFLGQVAFYLAALAGTRLRLPILRMSTFFLVVNLAILTAWYRYGRGERMTTWTPSERVTALPGPGAAPAGGPVP